MITKTFTYTTFYFSESSDFEYIRKIESDLNDFTISKTDVNFESYLEDLMAQKSRLDAEGEKRIVIYHTLLYDYQCNTEFSPRVIELINELGATFCLSADLDSEHPRKTKFYDLIDQIKIRPALYIGEASITALYAFLNGYGYHHEQIDYGNPSFDNFNDYVGRYYGKYTTAGWKNLILSAHYGNEIEALERFFVLLDEFRAAPKKPDARAIILRLMHVAMLDFRAEDEHQRQKQIADLLHHVSLKLSNAIYGGIAEEYDAILQDIFERANGNVYLHNWIKNNAPSTLYFEYELWSASDEKATIILANQTEKEKVLESKEKLIKLFFAINDEKANLEKEIYLENQLLKKEQKKMIEQHHLTFFTEYYQFYVLDKDTNSTTDSPDFWNDEAGTRKLAIAEGLLGVTVAKYAEIKVEVRVLNAEPILDSYADHVVETSLNLQSGILQIQSCTDSEVQLELKLSKGKYQIRISSFKLYTVKNDEGDDYYVVEIWEGTPNETIILKEYVQQ
jgi:hypothetical protein